MKKILVVFTGGTIGSKSANAVINVDETQGYTLLETFRRDTEMQVTFDTVQPLNILSENLVPRHWSAIYDTLSGMDLAAYSGIIITHGTDTLPYTTGVMSYLLAGLGLPVVFVASNRALDHPQSNGHQNFAGAVQFILGEGLPGVFAVFQNTAEELVVYLGTRLLEADKVTDQYRSYLGVDFGRMEHGKLVRNHHPMNPDMQGTARQAAFGIPQIRFDNKVISIQPYPGLDYSLYDLKKSRPAAILHGLYHSSTACIEPKENSIVELAHLCNQNGIDLYIHDSRNCVGSMYYTSRELLCAGVHTLTNLSYEAALAKLYVAYNQDQTTPTKYMSENLFFEYVED
ncbi:MAG: asparaginase domain-containing protein [Oscillospiraceae bacterium]|nr:asparaginase domain-containing protein [Oscillospiraceae bacterium]